MIMNLRLKITILLAFCAVILSAGCSAKPETPTFTGTVEATEVEVSSEVGGTVKEVFVSEGEKVRAQKQLLQIDPTVLQLQLEQALAALESAKAKLVEARSGAKAEEIEHAMAGVEHAEAAAEGAEKALSTAEENLERIEALYDSGVVSKQEVDEARARYDQCLTNFETARARVKMAKAQLALIRSGVKKETLQVLEANVKQAEKAVRLAEANLKKTDITAPIDGVVASVNISPGEMVTPGTSLITIVDIDNLWVEVFIPERILGRIYLGQEVNISSTSYPGKKFRGKVSYISPEAEFTPEKANTEEERADKVFKVKVRVLEGLDVLKSGMSADVTFPGLDRGGGEKNG